MKKLLFIIVLIAGYTAAQAQSDPQKLNEKIKRLMPNAVLATESQKRTAATGAKPARTTAELQKLVSPNGKFSSGGGTARSTAVAAKNKTAALPSDVSVKDAENARKLAAAQQPKPADSRALVEKQYADSAIAAKPAIPAKTVPPLNKKD